MDQQSKEVPRRVQLKRTRGWKMPANTVKVDRTTRWGNPFALKWFAADRSIALFESLFSGWNPNDVVDLDDASTNLAYRLHCEWKEIKGIEAAYSARHDLRGKNLGCWCSLDSPCHADVLLRIANS